MKKILFCLLCLIFLTLCACQPTPDSSNVVNKGDNDLASLAVETPCSDHFTDIPKEEDITFSSSDNSVIVNINATVSVPDVDSVPVAQFSPRGFTQDEIDSTVNILIQNKPLCKPRTLDDYTKDEIMAIILKLKSGQNSDLFAEDPDAYFNEIQPELDMYQELYEKAPEVIERKPGITKLETSPEDSGLSTVGVEADLGKSIPAIFSYINKDTQFVRFQFNNVAGQPPTGTVTGNMNVTGVTISVDEARQIADDTVSQMGLGDFSVNGVGTIPSLGTKNVLDYSGYDALPKCYIFYFTRAVNGLNETYVAPQYIQALSQQSIQYNFVWPCEVIEVTVDDTGILSINYTGPCPDNVNIINNNTQIKTFDEILDIFEKQILIQGAYSNDTSIIQIKIDINKIVLGGTKIIDKDHQGQYLFVPTWDFFGSVTCKYKPGTGDQGQLDENNEFIYGDYGYSIMTINAIDGSIIDRSQGY